MNDGHSHTDTMKHVIAGRPLYGAGIWTDADGSWTDGAAWPM